MKFVVIGGGVIGTSIAWHLAEEGIGQVTLLERDRLGSGTTWHSAGNITWKPLADHDASVMYAFETITRLERDLGLSTGWLQTGRLFLAGSGEVRHGFEGFDKAAQDRGVPARWLSGDEARRLNPLLDPGGLEGIWLNPLSGRVNPADLTAAYATAARRKGAVIRENVTAESLAIVGGRITGVATSLGFIPADCVVLAAGLWSRSMLQPLGIALAQWPCEHFYVIAEVAPRLPRDTPSFVAPHELVYGREEVGRFLVGFFDENAKTLDPASLPNPFSFTLLPPDWEKIAPYFAAATRLFPPLETAPIRNFINGPESFTPDGFPLIGRVADIDGLIVATAMNSSGVTLSAMTGRLVADLVTGAPPRFEAGLYDPSRFADRARDLAWLATGVSSIVSAGYLRHNQ
ncbi:NAD(P)/FAD-dependent oxidoreductase [Bradyrhizobium sp.]|uniref:NAD(P)/FAD-dependent oxidoreductase n=1 Tax=Bradyrhizobium sp. TaxID=376 RepID=UPI0025C40368|nr:FAD-binding oxidoreductase [Bradyrhizobium sp.]MBV8921639.1 FAD-binding oxidoreductase [Bradyrhizobium sp.]